MSDWDECLNRIADAVPETEAGLQQLYHYLSFGWLCGGIIEVYESLVLFISYDQTFCDKLLWACFLLFNETYMENEEPAIFVF